MSTLKIGLAQIAPVWLDKAGTTTKVVDYIKKAGQEKCDLVVFGEGFLPGYPFWLSFTLRCSLLDGSQTVRVSVNTLFGRCEVSQP